MRDLTDRKGEELIHQNKREQKGWTSRQTGCTGRSPMDGMVIKKQTRPNRITAESEFTTKLWNNRRILTSDPPKSSPSISQMPGLLISGEEDRST